MTGSNSQEAASARLEEAIGWHIRLGDGDVGEADWEAFTRWLEADPGNRLAYDRVENLDLELENPALADDVENEEARLVSFRRIAARPTWIAGAALLAASLIVFFMVHTEPAAPISYATRAGEMKPVMLADGTEIELNTATKILVDITGDYRRVTLAEGEAYFDVAKDARRPFSVRAGNRIVRDIGTKFDVLRTKSSIAVTVAEGRVSVAPRGAKTGAISLVPGDRLLYSETADTTRVEHVDPAEALAWRQGYLIYHDAPLSKVVSDLNRYFPQPITLDAAAAAQRFSGVLRVDDEKAVLKRISLLLPVRVEYGPGGSVALRSTAPKP
jgi:transmembrane sensor